MLPRQIAAQAAAMEQKAMAQLLAGPGESQQASLQADDQQALGVAEKKRTNAGECEICCGNHSSQGHVDTVNQKSDLAYGSTASRVPHAVSRFTQTV